MQVTRSRRPAQAIYAKKNEEFLFDLLGWSRIQQNFYSLLIDKVCSIL